MFAKMGVAMPDGSYYIRPDHPEDLQNAIDSVGRAAGSGGKTDEEQRNAVRSHIIKRAKDLKKASAIPSTWNPDGTLKHDDVEIDPNVEEFLTHFGVKGMHWGVRKDRGSSTPAPRAKPSTDAARAEKISAKAEAGAHTLTNKELKDLVNRMQLEQQYTKLNTPESETRSKNGKNFVQKYNGHAATGLTAFKTTKEIAKIVAPLIVAAAAGAAAAKATGNTGPVRMPQLAIGA